MAQPLSAAATPRWPRSLRSKRLRLRAIGAAELKGAAQPAWLAAAADELLGPQRPAPLRARLAAGEAGYWIDLPRPDGPDGDAPHAVGALSARLQRDQLVWGWLALDPDWRARGLAAAAVPLVERAAARAGAKRACVRVSAANGVALYFWLRLGYRPLRQPPFPPFPAAGDPATGDDATGDDQNWPGTWMLRELP